MTIAHCFIQNRDLFRLLWTAKTDETVVDDRNSETISILSSIVDRQSGYHHNCEPGLKQVTSTIGFMPV